MCQRVSGKGWRHRDKQAGALLPIMTELLPNSSPSPGGPGLGSLVSGYTCPTDLRTRHTAPPWTRGTAPPPLHGTSTLTHSHTHVRSMLIFAFDGGL